MADGFPSRLTPLSDHYPSDSLAPKEGFLTQQLDHLLEQYLELLDQYTEHRNKLSKTLTSGFFDLAKAQRSSNLGAGRRYGQEGYDARMKALRRVRISIDGDSDTLSDTWSCRSARTYRVCIDAAFSELIATKQLDMNGSSSHEQAATQRDEMGAIQALKSNDNSESNMIHRDPITWYGILVPSMLRLSQKDFIRATVDDIPALLPIDFTMRDIETKIWKLRKQIADTSQRE